MPARSSSQPPVVEAIDRALVLLTALADSEPAGSSLRELSATTGISKPTAYRALSTMRARGFVTQSDEANYHLGVAVSMLGQAATGNRYLATVLKAALVELSRRCDELVHLGTWDGDHVTYVDKVEPSRRPIRVWSSIGHPVPAASSALGRALLGTSLRTDDELCHLIDCLPEGRHVTLDRLHNALSEVAATGFASETEENEPGIACIARAIIQNDKPVAAVSVTCLASGLTTERADELRRIITQTLPPVLPDGFSLFSP